MNWFLGKITFPLNKRWLFCILIFLFASAKWNFLLEIVQRSQEFSSSYLIRPRSFYKETIHVADVEENCGLKQPCPPNSFAIFLSTGTFPENKPKLCVGGKYLIKPTKEGEARGLNAAVVEPVDFEVISVRNFDTYLYNKSIEISEWIDDTMNDDIIIIFTYDEASAKLGGETKAMLNELGSGKIQNLQYRSQWYMITQKGSEGFTTYEKITYSKKKNWGEKIEFRGCIPKTIPKKITTADEPLKQNKKKLQYCYKKQEDRYKGFCNEARFEMIMPALLTNKSLIGNPVYTMPIYLFASQNLEIMIAALDNLIHQPGASASLVTVLYENNTSDIDGIVKIYGTHSNKTIFGETFEKRLSVAREIANKVYPKKSYAIAVDFNVIPSPDFLFFLAQVFPTMEKDKNISVISGWSPNCYAQNGSVHVAYRVQGYPKYSALVSSKSDYKFFGEMFAPDVARVQGPETCHLPSLEPGNWIERPQDLLKDRYFHKMVMLQRLGQVIEIDDVLSSCSPSVVKNDTNVIYIRFEDKRMLKLISCLGVLNNQYGEYEGIVRLFIEGKTILVITSDSSFYKSRPIVSV